MTIRFNCDCGQELQAHDEHAGRPTRCPACNREMTIPEDDQPVRPRPAERVPAYPRDADEWPDRGEARPAATSGKAVAAFVLGLLSFCLWLIAAIPAVILGIISLVNISRSGGRLKGQGLAIAGIVLGALGGLIMGPVILIALLVPAVQKVREAAANTQSANNLKLMSLAMHNYHANYDCFPFQGVRGHIRHESSWRAAILPYVGEETLHRQYRFDEAWDGPNNSRLLTRMPKVFAHPNADPATTAAGLTHYRVFVGPRTAFGSGTGPVGMMSITDGIANTILIVEARDPVPWLKPEGIPFEPDGQPPPLGGLLARGFNVAMADGSVRMVRKDHDPGALRAAITASGDEKVNLERDLFGR